MLECVTLKCGDIFWEINQLNMNSLQQKYCRVCTHSSSLPPPDMRQSHKIDFSIDDNWVIWRDRDKWIILLLGPSSSCVVCPINVDHISRKKKYFQVPTHTYTVWWSGRVLTANGCTEVHTALHGWYRIKGDTSDHERFLASSNVLYVVKKVSLILCILLAKCQHSFNLLE